MKRMRVLTLEFENEFLILLGDVRETGRATQKLFTRHYRQIETRLNGFKWVFYDRLRRRYSP